MLGEEIFVAVGASLVLAAVLASKVSSRLGVPALLIFLAVGMLAGTDGVGLIDFEDVDLARTVGVVSLAYILFAGGLSTRWSLVRRVAVPGVVMATLGVVATAGVTGAFAAWVLDVPLLVGLLVGAIVSSTDAAAVFSVLRSRNVSLRGELRPLLELESASNDPMAVFLTIGLLELLAEPDRSALTLVPMFFQQMTLGALVGLLVARASVWTINRLRLEYDGLYSVVTLTVVVLTYSATAAIGGSGFLAVYLTGLVMGSSDFVHKKSLERFHDAIAWLAQIAMFLVLGLLVFPSQLPSVAGPAVVVALVLVLVARPFATLVTLALSRFGWRERLMVGWVGLRGAAPIILATFPLVAGIPEAGLIFDVVFFVVLISVLVQGTSIPFVAKRLHVDAPLVERPPYPLEAVSSGHMGATLHELVVTEGAEADGSTLIELGLPEGALVVLISRDDEFVVPQGSSILLGGDEVLVLADAEAIELIRPQLEVALEE